jgi:hypothetical protein
MATIQKSGRTKTQKKMLRNVGNHRRLETATVSEAAYLPGKLAAVIGYAVRRRDS